jgi:hypothetical protein
LKINNAFLRSFVPQSVYLVKLRIFTLGITVVLALLGFRLYQRNIAHQVGDMGDAPRHYGKATHFHCDQGPFLGKTRGDQDTIDFLDDDFTFCNRDDAYGDNDEDAFTNNYTLLENRQSTTVFLPDIQVNQASYVLDLPVSGVETGDPVRAWIDFNGNGLFDTDEKAVGTCEKGRTTVALTWILPENLQPSLTYARFRITSREYEAQIDYPDGSVKTGEVEDYVVRIIQHAYAGEELRKSINFNALAGIEGRDSVMEALRKVPLGGGYARFHFSGLPPEIAGINNLHEASFYGLRIGHDSFDVTTEKPAIISIGFDSAQENLQFNLLDIDGGDRMRIQGFYKGRPHPFTITPLTDNYYYQFDKTINEIYSKRNCDAGNDSYMPSSLDMGMRVSFEGRTDSIVLFYADEEETSGTVTICNISSRKYNLPPVRVLDLRATDEIKDVVLQWSVTHPQLVQGWQVERSLDGKLYELVGRSTGNITSSTCSFTDVQLPPGTSGCYYRIRLVETDNHTSQSQVLYLKRKITNSLSGFAFVSPDIKDSLQLVILKDMPGEIRLRLYEYTGKTIRRQTFNDLHENDTLTIKYLTGLRENSYYIELVNNNNQYLREAFKTD